MYNDTIKVANKIISDSDLLDIFQKMNDCILENTRICREETYQNEKYEREYQHWTVKDFEGKITCTFDFYDDTNITVDNYNNFITLFNNRISEIKDMWIRYSYHYWIQDGKKQDYVTKHINIYVYEHKMNIDVNLGSEDNKMRDVYELIKEKILASPERYDDVVKNKNSITNKICFAQGVIPSIIICTLLFFVPAIKQLYGMIFLVYPIAVLMLGFVLGNLIFGGKIDSLYSSIEPDKKYAGYDSSKRQRIYKDDIDSYIEKSEIIIGKNINNIRNRKEIVELKNKYSKYIPKELLVIIILTIIMMIIC